MDARRRCGGFTLIELVVVLAILGLLLALLPDVLSAFLDGVCVRAVLEVDGAVPALGRNIEAFLCRVVPQP